MKMFMKALFVLCSLIIGLLASDVGFAYFISLDPKFDNWIAYISSFNPERVWVLALCVVVSGLYFACMPMARFLVDFNSKQDEEKE